MATAPLDAGTAPVAARRAARIPDALGGLVARAVARRGVAGRALLQRLDEEDVADILADEAHKNGYEDARTKYLAQFGPGKKKKPKMVSAQHLLEVHYTRCRRPRTGCTSR